MTRRRLDERGMQPNAVPAEVIPLFARARERMLREAATV